MNYILIIDDNERFAITLKQDICEFEDYETGRVEITCSPREAISLARRAVEAQQPFNVFLLDQNLDADMDGIQTMRELLDIYPEADTIIFTGYDTTEDGLRAYEAGASRYLPKPFEPKELEFVLKELARSRKVRVNEARQQRQFRVATEIAEAVGANLELEFTMTAILQTLMDVFDKTRLCVLLYYEEENALRFAPATLRYYQIDNPQFMGQDTFPLGGRTIVCRVANKTLFTQGMEIENIGNVVDDDAYLDLNPGTKSECCVSLLNTSHELLGILALERSRVNGFEEGDLALIRMAARHIGLAIERARQSEMLETKSFVSAQTSWAVNIAHEINSEVGKIANWAYLIQRGAPENSAITEYAKNIEESAYQLSAANPWTSKPPKSVDVDEVIFKYIEKLRSQKGEEIELEYQLGAGGKRVVIKPVQFQFVVKQMVNNAIQAMRKTEKKKIIVSTRVLESNFIEIRFQDFGDGIEMHNRALLFRKPYTTKEKGGYGLLLAHQMLEEMLGRISLEPYQPGEGAAFLIRLPIDAPA
ncbi:MAG: response regulator [Anaerolineales bacterium]|nr:response regulator [Anaerolineales bacterium]